MIRSLAVLLIALAPLSAGAETITYTWMPRSDQRTEALLEALGRQAQRNGATVRQAGQGNEAEVVQSGTGNQGVIIQRGRDNSATLTQTGTSNSYAIIQLGRGNTADVAQTGGEAGVTIQISRPGRNNPT